MSALFERLSTAFTGSAHLGRIGIRDDRDFAPPDPRPAAVLMAVTERDEPGMLLTHRPESMSNHPGQVAFPGGKIEQGEDPVDAALREAHEELAIDPGQVRVVGAALPFVTGSGFHLTPVLGTVPADLPLIPDPREVDSWFEAPLSFLLDLDNHIPMIGEFNGFERPYVEINWQGHRIWGITAGIINHLAHRLDWRELVK